MVEFSRDAGTNRRVFSSGSAPRMPGFRGSACTSTWRARATARSWVSSGRPRGFRWTTAIRESTGKSNSRRERFSVSMATECSGTMAPSPLADWVLNAGR